MSLYIPAKYTSGSKSEIIEAIQLLNKDIISSNDLSELEQLKHIKEALTLKLTVLSENDSPKTSSAPSADANKTLNTITNNSTNPTSSITKFKPPANIKQFILGKNFKKHILSIEKLCKVATTVPDVNVINVLMMSIPGDCDIETYIVNELLDRSLSWHECKSKLLEKFTPHGESLHALFNLFEFEFKNGEDIDAGKARFLEILNCTEYDLEDEWVTKLLLKKLPTPIFKVLNAMIQIETISTYHELSKNIRIAEFKISNNENLNGNETEKITEALNFFNAAKLKSANVSVPPPPPGLKPICFNKLQGKDCAKDPCNFDHSSSNIYKSIKYLSKILSISKSNFSKSKSSKSIEKL
jgi:hypothetical protein